MNLIAAWPRFLRPDLAAEYVGGEIILKAMVTQKLTRPKIQRKGFTVYDRLDLDAACDAFKRLEDE